MSQTLPLFHGAESLSFRCSGCGACCRELRVTLTHRDWQRLREATGHEERELVDWLLPDEVDMTNEPSSFVELREGRRLMVLAQRDGACRLLRADNRCSAYAARPLDCRLFPFQLARETNGAPRALTLLELAACDYSRDGHNDLAELARLDAERWQELSDYQALVARWNRHARHRLRLGRRAGTAAEFLQFLAHN